MTVRLVKEYRRGAERVPAGTPLELPDDEAARLIEDGLAVPYADDASETR